MRCKNPRYSSKIDGKLELITIIIEIFKKKDLGEGVKVINTVLRVC